MRPVTTDNLSLITSLLKDLEIVGMTNPHARELDAILRQPHIRVSLALSKDFLSFYDIDLLFLSQDGHGRSSSDSNT